MPTRQFLHLLTYRSMKAVGAFATGQGEGLCVGKSDYDDEIWLSIVFHVSTSSLSSSLWDLVLVC